MARLADPMDPQPFHKLALAEVEAVHRLAYHLCRDAHEADDLVQETYLRALRSADGFTPGEHGVRPWLFKILHNVLHTRRGKDRRRREVLRRAFEGSVEQDGPAAGSPSGDGPASAAGSVASIHWDGLDERLCRAIRALPLAHRTVFLLSAVEDLKYREIADVVGVPVGTVMSRLSRARATLVAQLDDLASERNLRRRTVGGRKA
jgi:RNA polymerase sigma-70 factor (ECF subfamily)